MVPRNILKEHIQHLLYHGALYTQRITEVFNTNITVENIADLETLIYLLEIHEESLKQTRRILELKQQSYIMTYMAKYVKNWTEINEGIPKMHYLAPKMSQGVRLSIMFYVEKVLDNKRKQRFDRARYTDKRNLSLHN